MTARKTPAPAPEPEASDDDLVVAEMDDQDAEVAADQATGEVIDDAEVVDDTPVLGRSSLTVLPTSSDPREWSEEQKALLDAAGLVKRQGGQVIPAPRSTIAAFLTHCHRTGLDPIARQIYCIERGGKWTITISIDGARLIAERSREYEGQTPVQWTADGVTWVDVWLRKDPPAAARVGVYRRGFREALYAVATWEAFAVMDRQGKPMSLWAKMGAHMLAKCAEMLALRKAFPQDLSGLYSAEEMDQAQGSHSPAAQPAARQIAAPTVASPDTKPAGGTLHQIHAQGVDEHKADAAALYQHREAEKQLSQPAPERKPADDPHPDLSEGLRRWMLWKDRIDQSASIIQLTQVRNQMSKANLLQMPIPGDDKGRVVEDYLVYRRGQLDKPASSGVARLQAGLNHDKPADVA